jgi:hypothetical protein
MENCEVHVHFRNQYSFVCRYTTQTAAVTKTNLGSSLARLLCADSAGQRSTRPLPMKCNDHRGGLLDASDVLGQVVIKEHSESCASFPFS